MYSASVTIKIGITLNVECYYHYINTILLLSLTEIDLEKTIPVAL